MAALKIKRAISHKGMAYFIYKYYLQNLFLFFYCELHWIYGIELWSLSNHSNFIHHSIGPSDDLSEVLRVAILDNGHCRENPELPALLSTLPRDVRQMFTRLQTESTYRWYHWERICSPAKGVNVMLKRLSALSTIDSLRAAVALVHGADDRVIPPSESVILHRRLRECNKKSRLSLTPAISHGDTTLTARMIPALLDLTGTFAFFFKHA